MEHPIDFMAVNTNRLINVVACAGLVAIALTHHKPASTLTESIQQAKAIPLTQFHMDAYPQTAKILQKLAILKSDFSLQQYDSVLGEVYLADDFLSDPRDTPLAYPLPLHIEKDTAVDMFARMSSQWDDTVFQATNPAKHTFGQLPYSFEVAQNKVFLAILEKMETLPAAQPLDIESKRVLSHEIAARMQHLVLPKDLDSVGALLDSSGQTHIKSYVEARTARIAALGTKDDAISEYDHLLETAHTIEQSVMQGLNTDNNLSITSL